MKQTPKTKKQKRFYWFSYQTARKSWRQGDQQTCSLTYLDTHRLRDGAMALRLGTSLTSACYEYGGLLLNFPSNANVAKTLRIAELPAMLSADDVVILPTRPPLDDVEEHKKKAPKRWHYRSHTDLESDVVLAMRPVFEVLSRKTVELTDGVSKQLAKCDLGFRRVTFEVNNGVGIESLDQVSKRSAQSDKWRELTVGYFLTVPCAINNARLIAAFGIGGAATLRWSDVLPALYPTASKWRSLLLSPRPRFVMASFPVPKTIGYPFASGPRKGQTTLLLDITL